VRYREISRTAATPQARQHGIASYRPGAQRTSRCPVACRQGGRRASFLRVPLAPGWSHRRALARRAELPNHDRYAYAVTL